MRAGQVDDVLVRWSAGELRATSLDQVVRYGDQHDVGAAGDLVGGQTGTWGRSRAARSSDALERAVTPVTGCPAAAKAAPKALPARPEPMKPMRSMSTLFVPVPGTGVPDDLVLSVV